MGQESGLCNPTPTSNLTPSPSKMAAWPTQTHNRHMGEAVMRHPVQLPSVMSTSSRAEGRQLPRSHPCRSVLMKRKDEGLLPRALRGLPVGAGRADPAVGPSMRQVRRGRITALRWTPRGFNLRTVIVPGKLCCARSTRHLHQHIFLESLVFALCVRQKRPACAFCRSGFYTKCGALACMLC